jgi:hypothetical protein
LRGTPPRALWRRPQLLPKTGFAGARNHPANHMRRIFSAEWLLHGNTSRKSSGGRKIAGRAPRRAALSSFGTTVGEKLMQKIHRLTDN